MTDYENRKQVIKEMREIDPDTGKPKHTQKEVAEELGLSESRICQLEKKYGITGFKELLNQTVEEHINTADNIKMVEETETEVEEQNEEHNEEEGSDWFCESCGNNTFYDSDEYVENFNDSLTKGQILKVSRADKVCAACGTIQ